MPGWPGGLGNRLQDGRAAVDQGLGDRLQAPLDERDRPYLERNYLLARIAAAPSKLFGGLFVDPVVGALENYGKVLHGDTSIDPVKAGFDLASIAGAGPEAGALMARGKPVASAIVRGVRDARGLGDALQGGEPSLQGMQDYASTLPVRGPVEPVPGRISTRLSSEEKKNPTHTLSIGAEDVLNSHTQKAGYDNMDIVRDYAGMRHMQDAPKQMDAAVAGEYMRHNTDNLLWLYSKLPEWKDRAKNWYVGAHRLAEEWAAKHGIPTESVAGALAALSPKADWFRNASYAERVLDMVAGKNAGRPWSSDMGGVFKGTPTLHGYADVFKAIKGKRLDQLTDDTERGLWMTLFDRAHNGKNYRLANPEGDLGDFATNKGADLSEVGAASIANIAKADKAIRSGGNLNILSPLMGEAHKVRNFFNNISVPWDKVFRDATIDTHQVAAGHLLPLGQNSAEVGHILGTNVPPGARTPVNSVVTGVKGTYGLGLDALRHGADIIGMLPRELQSSAWEGIKALFSPEAKRDKLFVPKIYKIWDEVDAGRITPHDARELIFGEATRGGSGALRLPRWAGRDFKTYDPRRTSTYETNLP